jgi:hypothetical protein
MSVSRFSNSNNPRQFTAADGNIVNCATAKNAPKCADRLGVRRAPAAIVNRDGNEIANRCKVAHNRLGVAKVIQRLGKHRHAAPLRSPCVRIGANEHRAWIALSRSGYVRLRQVNADIWNLREQLPQRPVPAANFHNIGRLNCSDEAGKQDEADVIRAGSDACAPINYGIHGRQNAQTMPSVQQALNRTCNGRIVRDSDR